MKPKKQFGGLCDSFTHISVSKDVQFGKNMLNSIIIYFQKSLWERGIFKVGSIRTRTCLLFSLGGWVGQFSVGQIQLK